MGTFQNRCLSIILRFFATTIGRIFSQTNFFATKSFTFSVADGIIPMKYFEYSFRCEMFNPQHASLLGCPTISMASFPMESFPFWSLVERVLTRKLLTGKLPTGKFSTDKVV
jgi:hypothetical protein